MPNSITKALEQNLVQLLSFLDQVPDQRFSAKPSDETWSIQEIIEHLIRSEMGTIRVLNGKSRALDRPADAQVYPVTRFMENDSIKAKAPKGLDPEFQVKEKSAVAASLKSAREKLIETVATIDLNLIYLNFEHPVGGYMTGLEWATFTIAHAERHLRQARRVLESFA